MDGMDFREISLFEGLSDEESRSVLSCIGAANRRYQKGEMIFLCGDEVKAFGIVRAGSVKIAKEDAAGNQTTVAIAEEGEVFGEVFAYAGVKKSPVCARAETDAQVILIDYQRILYACGNACAFHTRLIQNLLGIVAQKNLRLNEKINYLMMKSMRTKIASYLLEQLGEGDKTTFQIPFSRSGLAEFLGADRSALSRELCRMRDEGLIDFYRSSFKLTDIPGLRQSRRS